MLGFGWHIIAGLVVILVIQIASAGFFLIKLLSEFFLFEFRWMPWEVREILEILSSLGLLLGVVSSVGLLTIAYRRSNKIAGQLQAAAGQFYNHVELQFDAWKLTPTERHVAILVIKGFSNAEVAKLRGTTESTVKTQLSSIFRKSELNSRQQLVALVIEDLVAALPAE